MTIEEMKQRKREMGLTNAELAKRTCVPVGTINKIFSGQTKAPRQDTILALESVLNCIRAENGDKYTYILEREDASVLREPDNVYQVGTSPVKKRQGEFTLEDYLALPDVIRAELIDGYLYEMAAPHAVHQAIILQIGVQLLSHVNKKKGSCRPFISPVDVQLDQDDKTVVQPDIIILCNPKAYLKNGRVWGAPDFVAEILSPSTRKRDLTLKMSKYSEAGVRELWYIDPKNLRVMTYILDGEEMQFPVIYTFNDSIPVHIWNDEFSVDFTKVYEDIKDYLD